MCACAQKAPRRGRQHVPTPAVGARPVVNTAAALSRSIVLPPLPYALGALHPVISADTLNFHYGKHHKTYVETLNKLIAGTEFADQPLEDIVKAAWRQPAHTAIFNNAAQAWNHTFYWNSLKPNGGGEPPATLKRVMDSSFGGVARPDSMNVDCRCAIAVAMLPPAAQRLDQEHRGGRTPLFYGYDGELCLQ